MAIVDCLEIWGDRQGMQDGDGSRAYTRYFRVTTNSGQDGPLTVMQAPGLPQLYDNYSDPSGVFDIGCTCVKVTPRQDQGDPFTWLVVCDYDTSFIDALLGDKNPLNRRATKNWAPEKFQEPYDRDALGTAVLNSAGEPFDPLPVRDATRLVLTIERFEQSFDQQEALSYADTVNAESFQGFAAGLVKCDSITGNEHLENAILCYHVRYIFHFDELGWVDFILDAGYKQIDPADATKRIVIKDKYFQPYSSPTPLDGLGHPLAAGAPPVFLQYDPYPQKSFIPLNLP